MKTLYFIEVTDIFGGEANYSWATRHVIKAKSLRGADWATRHVIKAKSLRGAVNALSRRSGISWHSVGCNRYDSKSGATCFFIEEFDPELHDKYRFDTDDRS